MPVVSTTCEMTGSAWWPATCWESATRTRRGTWSVLTRTSLRGRSFDVEDSSTGRRCLPIYLVSLMLSMTSLTTRRRLVSQSLCRYNRVRFVEPHITVFAAFEILLPLHYHYLSFCNHLVTHLFKRCYFWLHPALLCLRSDTVVVEDVNRVCYLTNQPSTNIYYLLYYLLTLTSLFTESYPDHPRSIW